MKETITLSYDPREDSNNQSRNLARVKPQVSE